jgi:hypothetical protein
MKDSRRAEAKGKPWRSERDIICGKRKSILLLEGSQAMATRPYVRTERK